MQVAGLPHLAAVRQRLVSRAAHAQPSTTEIYTLVSIERVKAVHVKTHPAHL